ncbi:shufflon system plasmid conjugative transfer pilus tip adhesin PilV [Pseudomonas hunanensis]|uniref:Shufflon system plasmid conjugative transfer pilus tip adhesin PilV n=1 Tax=Pseudomonas hunanensis TaxID=1247546 RepID=A0ACC9MX97_9PSED|nr:shufflon system plasmid conjugative transfer pilus tip adhesin PilV [Pseudomonas hunanensis]PKF23671.1 shufflon system plasmid conjugative transfer pilus tip adhesin PilV [Pseudomonas hunanensis]TXI83725.1 MAG: shufflon system plasmid conjugative transfer pilus tip adhesin PilV [Cupriavidus sp.]
MASKRGQAGFFTIDGLFGLIVMSIMLSLAGWWMLNYGNQQDYRIAAEHQRTVADAFAKYLKDNYSVVLSNASPTTPVQVTVDMLQNTKYLPAGFSSTNSFGQTIVGLARRLNANQLEAIVVTTGGQVIPELGIRTIAEHLGGPGGFISSLKPGVIQGVRGGWEVALSNYGINPGQGHTASALFLMDGELANDYLYRNAVPGHPEYNRMNTAIDMGGNDITNARTLNATSNITTTDGWFRSQNDTGWVNGKWGGGIYQSDADWVRVLNNKGLLTGGKVRGGTLQADGRVTVGEYLDIESTAAEGQACPKIGVQSKTALGAPLTCQCITPTCQSAAWKSAGAADFLVVNCVMNNWASCTPICPSGYTLKSSSGVYGKNSSYFADRYYGVGVCTR